MLVAQRKERGLTKEIHSDLCWKRRRLGCGSCKPFFAFVSDISLIFSQQPEYQDLLNTYVSSSTIPGLCSRIFHSFQRVMHSILSTRTVLHVRTLAAQQDNMDTGSMMPISEARFQRGQGSSDNSETRLLDISRVEQSVPG